MKEFTKRRSAPLPRVPPPKPLFPGVPSPHPTLPSRSASRCSPPPPASRGVVDAAAVTPPPDAGAGGAAGAARPEASPRLPLVAVAARVAKLLARVHARQREGVFPARCSDWDGGDG